MDLVVVVVVGGGDDEDDDNDDGVVVLSILIFYFWLGHFVDLYSVIIGRYEFSIIVLSVDFVFMVIFFGPL